MADRRERELERAAHAGDKRAERKLNLIRCQRGDHAWDRLPWMPWCLHCDVTHPDWTEESLRMQAARAARRLAESIGLRREQRILDMIVRDGEVTTRDGDVVEPELVE